MNEREVQAQLHPHTGQVEVQPADMDPVALVEAALKQAMRHERALALCRSTLEAISQSKTLEGAQAKSTLEYVDGLLMTAPELRPIRKGCGMAGCVNEGKGEQQGECACVTYDHAGPDY